MIDKIYVAKDFERVRVVIEDDTPEERAEFESDDDLILVWERPRPFCKAGDRLRWAKTGNGEVLTVLWADETDVLVEWGDSGNVLGRDLYTAEYLRNHTVEYVA